MSGRRVVHVSTVHDAFDTRIYYRECRALAEGGYDVVLLTSDPAIDRSPQRREYAEVRRVVVPPRRAKRALLGAWRMGRACRASGADLVHIHDPELLLMVPAVRRHGVKVVYDAHEDLAAQVLGKEWIPAFLRPWVSKTLAFVLPRITRRLDAVVAATPDVAERHEGSRVVTVRNLPILAELEPPPDAPAYPQRPPRVAYVGGITILRGALNMAKAVASLSDQMDIELALAGAFSSAKLESIVRATVPNNLHIAGELDRDGVKRFLSTSRVGLVLVQPTPAYLRSLPVKMFEYMAAGLPIVASDFPLWREIIEGAGCGCLVDPSDPEAIAVAIKSLLEDPDRAEGLGRSGRAAVEDRYGWSSEAEILCALYAELLGGP